MRSELDEDGTNAQDRKAGTSIPAPWSANNAAQALGIAVIRAPTL